MLIPYFTENYTSPYEIGKHIAAQYELFDVNHENTIDSIAAYWTATYWNPSGSLSPCARKIWGIKDDNSELTFKRIYNANGGIGKCEHERSVKPVNKTLKVLIDGSQSIDNFQAQLNWCEQLVRGVVGAGLFNIEVIQYSDVSVSEWSIAASDDIRLLDSANFARIRSIRQNGGGSDLEEALVRLTIYDYIVIVSDG